MKPTEAATLRAVCDYLDRTNQVWLRHNPTRVILNWNSLYDILRNVFHHRTTVGEAFTKIRASVFAKVPESQLGAPDLLWWKREPPSVYPKTIALEIKSPTGKQSDDQKRWQEKFERVGGEYWLIRSVDEFLQYIGRVK